MMPVQTLYPKVIAISRISARICDYGEVLATDVKIHMTWVRCHWLLIGVVRSARTSLLLMAAFFWRYWVASLRESRRIDRTSLGAAFQEGAFEDDRFLSAECALWWRVHAAAGTSLTTLAWVGWYVLLGDRDGSIGRGADDGLGTVFSTVATLPRGRGAARAVECDGHREPVRL